LISTLIGILLLLVIAYVVYLVLTWVLGMGSLPAPMSQIIWIIFAIDVMVALLDRLGIYHLPLR